MKKVILTVVAVILVIFALASYSAPQGSTIDENGEVQKRKSIL